MARGVKLANLLVLLCRARFVVHVPEMVFSTVIIDVVTDQLIFVWKLEQNREQAEELYNDFLVAFLGLSALIHQMRRSIPCLTRLNSSIVLMLSCNTGGCCRV